MSSPRKSASDKNFQLRSQRAKKRQAKRDLRLEQLEDRRLMAVAPINGKYYPPIGIVTGDFKSPAARNEYIALSQQQFGAVPRGPLSGYVAGETGGAFTTSEVEPNDNTRTAQLLPLGTSPGKNMVVTVNGQLTARGSLPNIFAEPDYFAFDAKAGELITVRLSSAPPLIPFTVSLLSFNEFEYIGASDNQLFGAPPPSSPIADSTSTVAFSEWIPADGRYYIRVGDAAGAAYSLRLEARQNSIESEPIGTKQIIFVDFDGAFLNGDDIGLLPITTRGTSMMEALEPFGFEARQENEIIDKTMQAIQQYYLTDLPTDGRNGYFGADSIPGNFDIEFRNSRDHADPWGLPNVSRLIIGSFPTFGGLARGIAGSIDIGNFDREETALLFAEVIAFEVLTTVPLSPNKSVVDALTAGFGATGAHEIGHYLGARHQTAGNSALRVMDSGAPDYARTRLGAGIDGIFGTADDVRIRFGGIDSYAEFAEGQSGRTDHAINLAFALGTGTRGSTISGTVFNDRNRNGSREGNDEGLDGWQVFADLNNDGTRQIGEPNAFTNSLGAYSFVVRPGTYNVRVVHPVGWVPSTPNEAVKSINATGGSAVANFGAARPSDQATGFKWLDLNSDGIRDDNEPGLAGVFIYLDLDGDARPDFGEPSAVSGVDGSYVLTPPSGGTYTIREVVQPGFRQTFPADNGGHTVTYDGRNPLRGFNFGNAESADWGDAPISYPTTRAANGASHGQLAGLRLGTLWDAEPDGKPSLLGDGDDTAGVDDEDGVQLLNTLIRGDNNNLVEVRVTNSTGAIAFVNGWIDFNGDGDWNDANEQIVSGLEVASSSALFVRNVMFSAPSTAPDRVNARFRLSGQRDLGPSGRASSGEVEDYSFPVFNPPRRSLQPDSFTVTRNSRDNVFDVLANDFTPAGQSWQITGVSSTLRGGRVTIDTINNRLVYTPALSFIGIDEFEYTARSSLGVVETAKVTVSVLARFVDPVALDDSFDLPTNSIGFPLNVLANDIEGQNGALAIVDFTNPSRGGTVSIGTGSQSLRYTPPRGFGGTETFQYTASDGAGRRTTATVTVHTVEGDRADDTVEFSFEFFDDEGNQITRIQQGKPFRVAVYVDDLRPEKGAAQVPPLFIAEPGVFSAYLDVLYNSGLVAPEGPTSSSSGLDFRVDFAPLYPAGQSGTGQIPGLINELGAFAGNVRTMENPNREKLADLYFTANSPGLAEFIGDPADLRPVSDVTLFNTIQAPVPIEEIRYRRATIEIVPSGTNFPFAKDDSPTLVAGVSIPLIPSGIPSVIDVLANDIVGSNGPIRITSTRQLSNNGQVEIINGGTSIRYIPNTNFRGTDQFQYTITDQRGFTSTATVTLNVGSFAQVSADDLVELRLAATDRNGVEITQIEVGQPFQLRGFVKDLRDNLVPQPPRPGVFAAYQDILFNSGLVVANPDLFPFLDEANFDEDDSQYVQERTGDVIIAGLINELGSFQNDISNPLGFGEKLQFIINFTAGNTPGNVTFVGDPADIKPFHDSLLFEPTIPLNPNEIRYTFDTLTIVARGSTGGGGVGGGSGEGNTNPNNNMDVNNDGAVSAIDVLIVINRLNAGSRSGSGEAEGEGTKYYFDTNADGIFNSLDALLIVNFLNSRRSGEGEGLGEGEGEGLVNRADLPRVTLPFRKDPLQAGAWQLGDFAEEDEDESTLAHYIAEYGEEEEDYLDSLASNMLKKS